MLKRIVKRLKLLLFTHKCFLCGRVLEDESCLCADCIPQLPRTGESLCIYCGKRVEECICDQARSGYDRAYAPLFYSGKVRKGIWSYKYSGQQYYAPFLAELMAETFTAQMGTDKPDFITYVPLHPKKLRKRGFCQTEKLADALGKRLKLAVRGDLLAHTDRLQAQMELKGTAQREQNAEKSFCKVKGASLSGERVLLVDDLLTTGATARRSANLLKEIGASEVWVLTVATTRRKIEKSEKREYNEK